MKLLRVLTILTVAIVGFGQELAAYRYYVPLPEKTFSGEWNYVFEGGVFSEGPHFVRITGYNVLGYESYQYDEIQFEGPSGFAFFPFGTPDETPSSKMFAVQSLIFESDSQLDGVLWMVHRETGQLNAVSMNLDGQSEVIIPQIGTDYFAWKSGFALMGIGSEEASEANLNFRFYDLQQDSHNTELWTGLVDRGYIKKTPYFDVFLGDLDAPIAASWGKVISSNPNFQLTGFQTFSRVNGSLQSCAFELNSGPLSQGSFALRPINEQVQYSLTMTNSLTRDVDVTLSLHYLRTVIDPEEEISFQQLEREDIQLVLAGNGRLSGGVGSSWFAELFEDEAVQPLRVSFETDSLFEYNEALEEQIEVISPIHVLAFAVGGVDALGATTLVAPGNSSEFWLTNQSMVERTLVLQNVTDEVTPIGVTIYAEDGKIVGHNAKELAPSEVWSIQEVDLKPLFGESDVPVALRFSISSELGFFTLDMFAKNDVDIAWVNLPLEKVVPVEEEGLPDFP